MPDINQPIDTVEKPYTLDELSAALVERSKQPEPDQEIDSPAEPEAETSGSESDEQAEKPERLTPKALAEKLGMTQSQLYNLLDIDLGDGTVVTLSQWKDKAKQFARVEDLNRKAEEGRVKVENDLMQKRMALDNVARRRGYQYSEADLQEVRQAHDLHVKSQTALLAEIVPEFADAVGRDKGFQQINDVFKEYAFSDIESRFITDARLRKLAYDYARLRAAIDSVETKEVKRKPSQAPKSHTPVSKPIERGSLTRNAMEKEVAKLAKFL